MYLDEMRFLSEHLTQSADEVPVSRRIARGGDHSGGSGRAFPYRVLSAADEHYQGHGWNATNTQSNLDLYDDLALVEVQFAATIKGAIPPMVHCSRLMEKVRLFGLHLVPLDVREDARLHANALDEMFRYYGRTESYKALIRSR